MAKHLIAELVNIAAGHTWDSQTKKSHKDIFQMDSNPQTRGLQCRVLYPLCCRSPLKIYLSNIFYIMAIG